MAIGRLKRQPRKGEQGIVVCHDPYCHFIFRETGGYFVDVTAITQLVTTVGFPIACTFVLFSYLNKEREQHAAETKELKDALNNNTLVIQKLIDKMDGDAN
jgi:hypothetical protein